MTWSEKRKELERAIRDKRLGEAERLFEELRALSREVTDPRVAADESFAEGLLRDAQRRFEEAETAFRRSLEIDRRLRPDHPAVGESLHSLAIVRSNRGDHADALKLYRDALEIFRKTRLLHVPSLHASIGRELLALGDNDGALESFVTSERVARENEKTPRHDLARAIALQGDALMRMKEWARSFERFATCTRLATRTMWPELAREVGAAWNGVGIVSRHALRDSNAQAAFAFWFAAIVGSDAVKAKARAQLESLPERSLATGDPDQLRVVWLDAKGHVHVASCRHGLLRFRTKEIFELGDAVEVRDGKLAASDSVKPILLQ